MSLKKSLFQQNRRHALDRTHSSSSELNLTSDYHAAQAAMCMAASEHGVCALVSRPEIELISLESRQLTSLNRVKAQQYMPTCAEWQPRVASPKLAVGDSNGTFHLYDLHDQCELVYTQCGGSLGRSVRSLSFNSEQPNVLLTAISDGSTKLWDLRAALKQPVQTFTRPQDVARQCAFQPFGEHAFAVIYDSGIVQRWDTRQRHADVKINAHQQGLSLSWHPSLNFLASGGRDKLVHVWNMDKPTERPVHTLQTQATVSQLSWVPNSEAQELYFSVSNAYSTHDEPLATNRIVCAGKSGDINFLRRTYSVYELRNPFTPLHVIETHGSQLTAIKTHGSNCVLSADADGKFARTDLRHEPFIADNFAPRVLAWPSWDSPSMNVDVHPKHAPTPVNKRNSVQYGVSPVSLNSSPASSVYGSPLNLGFLSSSLGSVGSRRHSALGSVQPPQSTSHATTPAHLNDFFVTEAELPFCSIIDASFAQQLLFTRKSSQSFSDACFQNAETMLALRQYKLAEMWQMLKVAVSDSETQFCDSLQNSHDRQLAKQWFDGLGDCEEPVLIEDELALYEDDKDDKEWTEWDHTRRARRSTCGTTNSNRPKLLLENDAFRGVKEKYCAFVAENSMPWDLLPLLNAFVTRVVLTGSYITATSLLLLFRHFPCLYTQVNAKEIVQGGILGLQRNSAWVSATSVLKLLPLIKELSFDVKEHVDPEIVCHRCLHSLAENVGSTQPVQLWYCSRCMCALDGCSLCNRTVRGLCKVVLECGHRIHMHCWDVWLQEGINECPSGCGQTI